MIFISLFKGFGTVLHYSPGHLYAPTDGPGLTVITHCASGQDGHKEGLHPADCVRCAVFLYNAINSIRQGESCVVYSEGL